jgi:hypothetical protein
VLKTTDSGTGPVPEMIVLPGRTPTRLITFPVRTPAPPPRPVTQDLDVQDVLRLCQQTRRPVNVRQSRDGTAWHDTLCFVHLDTQPSFTFAQLGRFLWLGCRTARCPEAVIRAELMRLLDNPETTGSASAPEPARDAATTAAPPFSLEALAAAKALPVALLRDVFGLHDAAPTPSGTPVWIPYQDRSGVVIAEKLRTAIVAREGSKWPAGVKLLPYGLEDLDAMHETGTLVIVEGESDRWTLRLHEVRALALPGADTARTLRAEHVTGFARVVIAQDADDAGAALVQTLASHVGALWGGEVRVVRMPAGCKDVNDVHRQDPAGFRDWWDAAVAAAEPVTPTSATPAPGPAILTTLSDVEREEVRWLWSRRVPQGKLTILMGDPDLGKSTITLDMAARVTRGRAWPTTPAVHAPEGHVVILTAEDGLGDTVRPRVEIQGGDPSRVHVLTAVWRWVETKEAGETVERKLRLPFTLADDLDALDDAIRQTSAVLVIIDPLSAYLGSRQGRGADSFKDSDVRGLLAPLKDLAEQTGVAIVAVMHLNKDAQRRVIARGQGSLGFVAAARSVLIVGHDPEDETRRRRFLMPVKGNLSAKAPTLAYAFEPIADDPERARLVWEDRPVPDADRDPEAVLGLASPIETADTRAERAEARLFLEDFLRSMDGVAEVRAVEAGARANQISERALKAAKTALKVQAERVNSGGRRGLGVWLWRLPGASSDAARAEVAAKQAAARQAEAQTEARLVGATSVLVAEIQARAGRGETLDQPAAMAVLRGAGLTVNEARRAFTLGMQSGRWQLVPRPGQASVLRLP